MSKMTSSEQNEPTPEISTVDIDLEKQYAKVESSKHKVDFFIGKTRSASFFSIRTGAGVAPSELSGRYTTLEKALDAVNSYIRNAKETFAVKSDRLHEERQQRKYAESKPKNS
jgi:hypothetical protein